ncbi:MAG: TldD/PmbA family protein [Actinomycetota bacterium]|nr:TldD/PmbA family protein [Actinomycetota bacterium]MDI6822468.1 TldD/PmbA family protein [Actinomycetota bacterium]
MRDLIDLCLNTASVLGASYTDIRIVHNERESITHKNGKVEDISVSSDSGFGVRMLVNGAWGFASSFKLEHLEIEEITALAFKIAKASALAKKGDVTLAPAKPIQDRYKTNLVLDPFKVPLEKKLELLSAAEGIMRKNQGVKISQASMDSFKKEQIFANSEGSYIEQEITFCGAGIMAMAIRNGDVQKRSYPNSFRGQFATKGYEFIESLGLKENAERIAEEAVALLSAKECPNTTTTLILDGSQLALQIHESVGHAIELDRILGMEASFAGTSFLRPDHLRTYQYASPLVNITADATIEGALGTFGYDDEGVKAQRIEIVKEGKLVGFLTSRETAAILGQESNGTMRADGWNRIPLIRMTNINLGPGDRSLDEIIAETKEGIFLQTTKSWSIDDKRLNFQFATEIGWEIKNGKLKSMIKNANYTGITPQFWSSCDAIANRDHWQVWGTPNCGKGEPMQVISVGHGTSPARFRNIRIGVGK